MNEPSPPPVPKPTSLWRQPIWWMLVLFTLSVPGGIPVGVVWLWLIWRQDRRVRRANLGVDVARSGIPTYDAATTTTTTTKTAAV